MATNPSAGIHPLTGRTYAGVSYDVTYFARKHKLTKQQARDLIRKVGHDRDKLNLAAAQLKGC